MVYIQRYEFITSTGHCISHSISADQHALVADFNLFNTTPQKVLKLWDMTFNGKCTIIHT